MKVSRKFIEWAFLTVVILLLGVACGLLFHLNNTSSPQTIVWAEQRNYMFAVGIDDFDGDVYPSGIYTFYQDLTRDDAPVSVYDIYTSDTYYSNSSQLRSDEFRGSVGGISNETLRGSIDRRYVYVVYHGIIDMSSGVLKIDIEPY